MTIRHRHRSFNLSPLPLFAWADAQDRLAVRPIPLAARIIGRRHRLPVNRAILLAELAGLGGGK